MSPLKRTEASGRPGALVLLLLLAAGTWQAGRAVVLLLRDRLPLGLLWGDRFGLLVVVLAGCTALAAVALVRQARAVAAGGPVAGWWGVRAALDLALLVAAAELAWLQPYRSLVIELLGGVLGGLLGALLLAGPWLAARVPRRVRTVLDITLLNACVLGVGGELGLRAWAARSSSPLFAPADEGAAAMIARWRIRPGDGGPGYLANSHGFMDEEMTPGTPAAPVVATIGDSFSASIVPHMYHFTTVAERALGLKVHNVGVAAIGPREYERLLRTEVLELKPAVVVVDIFVGNDLTAPLNDPEQGRDLLRDWLDRDRLLLLRVPRLLFANDPGAHGARDGGGSAASMPTAEDLARLFPWLDDPGKEVAGMTVPQYQHLESHRALGVCGPAPPPWQALFETLRRMHALCTERGIAFAVMIIPDEFQVEDVVWDQVLADLPGEQLDRDLPQRVLNTFCREETIPCLDLLPRFRAVPKIGDGTKHLYSLRDSHWNRRGNAEAGAALAEFLQPLLGESTQR
ncbi:MAG TPA: hypothetical protein VFY71_02150 [Planctomycetota bacterium]|nr:hypothetical protein [Planctomycetota bacterium]